MPDEVFGMSREGARRTAEVNRRVLGQRVETGRRTRRVYPPGGGGGASIVAFKIVTANCTLRTATATVTAVQCKNGTGVKADDTIKLIDFVACFLTGSEVLLVGRSGYAVKMDMTAEQRSAEIAAAAAASPQRDPDFSCLWHIISLCCPTEVC